MMVRSHPFYIVLGITILILFSFVLFSKSVLGVDCVDSDGGTNDPLVKGSVTLWGTEVHFDDCQSLFDTSVLETVCSIGSPSPIFFVQRNAMGTNWQVSYEQKPCPSGKVCNNGVCVTACTNNCASGTKRCSFAAAYQTCVAGTGCYQWSSTSTTCPSGTPTCDQGNCVSSCSTSCFQGERRCFGQTDYQICNAPATGCPSWGSPINAGCLSTQHCVQIGSFTSCAANVPTCPSTCDDSKPCTIDGTCDPTVGICPTKSNVGAGIIVSGCANGCDGAGNCRTNNLLDIAVTEIYFTKKSTGEKTISCIGSEEVVIHMTFTADFPFIGPVIMKTNQNNPVTIGGLSGDENFLTGFHSWNVFTCPQQSTPYEISVSFPSSTSLVDSNLANNKLSATLTVLDTTPPTITLPGGTGTGTVTVTATCADCVDKKYKSISSTGTCPDITDTATLAPYAVTDSPTITAAGTYNYCAAGKDVAGNTAKTITPGTYTVNACATCASTGRICGSFTNTCGQLQTCATCASLETNPCKVAGSCNTAGTSCASSTNQVVGTTCTLGGTGGKCDGSGACDTIPPTVSIVDTGTTTKTIIASCIGCDTTTLKMKVYTTDPGKIPCPDDFSLYTDKNPETLTSGTKWYCAVAKDSSGLIGIQGPKSISITIKADGAACSDTASGSECQSGICKADYAPGAYYCAPISSSCVHAGVIYSGGSEPPSGIDCYASNSGTANRGIRNFCGTNGLWAAPPINSLSGDTSGTCGWVSNQGPHCVDNQIKATPQWCSNIKPNSNTCYDGTEQVIQTCAPNQLCKTVGTVASCVANPCTGKSCSPPANECMISGMCNTNIGEPTSGECSPQTPKTDDTPCGGNNICRSGQCVDRCAFAPACPDATNSCMTAGTCQSDTGLCSTESAKLDGTSCGATTICRSGSCVDRCSIIPCQPVGPCMDIGTCNSGTGICSSPTPKQNGVGCTTLSGSGTCDTQGNCFIDPCATVDCGIGKTCNSGQCVTSCIPQCNGKQCGDNGCGGQCGSCTNGKICGTSGQCIFNIFPTTEGSTNPPPSILTTTIPIGHDPLPTAVAGLYCVGFDQQQPNNWQSCTWVTQKIEIPHINVDLSLEDIDLVETNGILKFLPVFKNRGPDMFSYIVPFQQQIGTNPTVSTLVGGTPWYPNEYYQPPLASMPVVPIKPCLSSRVLFSLDNPDTIHEPDESASTPLGANNVKEFNDFTDTQTRVIDGPYQFPRTIAAQGKRAVFIAQDETKQLKLWVYDSANGQLNAIQSLQNPSRPAIDGNTIVYSDRRNGVTHAYSFTIAPSGTIGGTEQQLTTHTDPTIVYSDPSISGTTAVFSRFTNEHWSIVSINVNTKVILSELPGTFYDAQFPSINTNYIAYQENRNHGSFDIYVYDLTLGKEIWNTTGLEPLANNTRPTIVGNTVYWYKKTRSSTDVWKQTLPSGTPQLVLARTAVRYTEPISGYGNIVLVSDLRNLVYNIKLVDAQSRWLSSDSQNRITPSEISVVIGGDNLYWLRQKYGKTEVVHSRICPSIDQIRGSPSNCIELCDDPDGCMCGTSCELRQTSNGDHCGGERETIKPTINVVVSGIDSGPRTVEVICADNIQCDVQSQHLYELITGTTCPTPDLQGSPYTGPASTSTLTTKKYCGYAKDLAGNFEYTKTSTLARIIPTCVPACTIPSTQCSGNGFQTCVNDADGCAQWSTTLTACASDQQCVSGACACNNQCNANQKQCTTSTQYQTCVTTGNGCLRWDGVTTACTSPQQCISGSGGGICGPQLETNAPSVSGSGAGATPTITASWNTQTNVNYRLFKIGTASSVATTTPYPDTSVAAGTQYCYELERTQNGNVARSGQACATPATTKTAGTSCGGPTECQSGVCPAGICGDNTKQTLGCTEPCPTLIVEPDGCQCGSGCSTIQGTAISAGGSCGGAAPLSTGATCSAPSQCSSGFCVSNICSATDGVRTDISSCTTTCADTDGCRCTGTTCVNQVNTNILVNANCGGAAPLSTGATCSVPSQCSSGFCVSNVCSATDGVRSSLTSCIASCTDTDGCTCTSSGCVLSVGTPTPVNTNCGVPVVLKQNSESCTAGSQCQSNICSIFQRCSAPGGDGFLTGLSTCTATCTSTIDVDGCTCNDGCVTPINGYVPIAGTCGGLRPTPDLTITQIILKDASGRVIAVNTGFGVPNTYVFPVGGEIIAKVKNVGAVATDKTTDFIFRTGFMSSDISAVIPILAVNQETTVNLGKPNMGTGSGSFDFVVNSAAVSHMFSSWYILEWIVTNNGKSVSVSVCNPTGFCPVVLA